MKVKQKSVKKKWQGAVVRVEVSDLSCYRDPLVSPSLSQTHTRASCMLIWTDCMSTYINYGLCYMHYLLSRIKRHARLLDAITTSRYTHRNSGECSVFPVRTSIWLCCLLFCSFSYVPSLLFLSYSSFYVFLSQRCPSTHPSFFLSVSLLLEPLQFFIYDHLSIFHVYISVSFLWEAVPLRQPWKCSKAGVTRFLSNMVKCDMNRILENCLPFAFRLLTSSSNQQIWANPFVFWRSSSIHQPRSKFKLRALSVPQLNFWSVL